VTDDDGTRVGSAQGSHVVVGEDPLCPGVIVR